MMDGELNIRATGEPDLAGLVDQARAGSSATMAQSRTLPPGAYISREFFDLEMAKIFRKDWICVGHVSQVADIGDYFTVDLFGELLVVVRGTDRIRVMSRVCLHRWAPVASGAGNAKLFSCPFHKWGYGLDGQLLGAPFMEQAANFDPKTCTLPEVRSEIIEPLGLIFISFSDSVGSISERLSGLIEHLAPANLKDMVVVDTRETENDYNWKILIETFMECYHHIGAHRDTLEPNFPARLSYVEDEKHGWSLCHSPLREDLVEEAYSDDEKRPFSLYNIYPTLLMGSGMDLSRSDRINFITVIPVGPNKVISKRHTLVARSLIGTDSLEQRLQAQKDRGAKINKEDNEVNDMQQIGAASSFAPVGRLSHLEGSVWHLAEYVRKRLAAN
jgi:phenylpropionate dioxygenase-like ring-hydroxylating dioxygenase large terminal subunit